ncbi:MAG: nucleoside phosphorylase [Verrucomicrobiales bacterium]|nr:nucleoside phosphorylase [Verrucomicrobiales bacterium]
MVQNPLVCFAVREESTFFHKSSNVDFLITGMGRDNAFSSVEEYLQTHQPPFVLTCGFAGALSPALNLNSILYSCDDDFPLIPQLMRLGGIQGVFAHSSSVLTTRQEKKTLLEQSGANVVEMESSVIRELCSAVGIPSAIVRVISDTAREDLPLDFNQFMDSRQNMRMPHLIFHVLTHPAKIPPLMRFGKQTRQAARELGSFLNRLLAGS